MSKKWRDLRGIEVVSFGVSSVKASEEDERYIRDQQALANPNARAAFMTGATGTAMQNAASNEAGAMTGFMGMGMAANQGANMMNSINQQMYPPQGGYPGGPQGYPPQGGYPGGSQGYPPQGGYPGGPQGYPQQPAPQAHAAPAANAGWTCSCGTVNQGKFCSECGKPRPAAEWTCSCGTVNKGKFCSGCGTKRPE